MLRSERSALRVATYINCLKNLRLLYLITPNQLHILRRDCTFINMFRGLLTTISVLVVLSASLYQFWLKEALAVSFGLGRVLQPIEAFPYSCRRLTHDKLQACEDLWLDDEARVLYAACTGAQYRLAWVPWSVQIVN